MIVLDASAVVELLLRTPRGQSVESHLSAEMLAPELLDLECLSALGRLERAGQVSTDVADAAARGLSSLPVQRLSHLALADRAWSCRGSLRLADAFYVAAAQLVVLRYGRVVLDHATGCRTDSLFWIFSASKPLTAMLVHLLAQQGRLSLDNPVAEYWPDFAQHGKQAITIRHVLQHRAGVPVARSTLRDALAMGDWQRSVRALEHAQPRFPAGQVPAYHIISYGFILGELVRRACGASVPEVLADQVLGPYGLRDIHLGLPDAAWARAVPLRAPGASGRLAQAYLNRRAIRQAVVPAAGVSTTARDLALFSGVVADNDAALRALIDNGSATANELRTFLEQNQVDLGSLINNLVTTGETIVKYLPGIRQILVLYPYMVAGGYSVVAKNP